MQAWSGQLVTITYRLYQEAGTQPVQLVLDDISLGSAYPDLWVTIDNPQRGASPGDEIVYTINYGNQSSVNTSSNVIKVELSNDLALVDTSPVPSSTLLMPSIVWNVGDLAAKSGLHTIIVTTTVKLTATPFTTATTFVEISTVSPEIEQTNNHAEARLFIGYFTYLPIVLRIE